MAFVSKSKTSRSWLVRHGVTGRTIRRHQKRNKAIMDRNKLHKKFRPKRRNRGKRAKKRFSM